MAEYTDDIRAILSFIAEAGLLKRTPRAGWSVVGVEPCESVADHSFRCAVIGYCLAKMEKADAYRVLLMTLFGDIQEARTGDLHKMAQRYIAAEAPEDAALSEQIDSLPKAMKADFHSFRREYLAQKTRESIIARDADILECLIQAQEYLHFGYQAAAAFTRKAPRHLKTASARRLWQQARSADFNEWWLALTRFTR